MYEGESLSFYHSTIAHSHIMKNIWRYILNTPFSVYNGATEVPAAARKAGYSMFTWNGIVYATPAETEAWNAHPLFTIEEMKA